MKKLVLLLIPMFLVGCAPKEEYFSKECVSKINSTNITDTEKRKVTYNNLDEVTSMVITKTYKAKDETGNIVVDGVKKSLQNYNNNLAKSKNIKVKNTKDEEDVYVVKYYFDVKNMDKDELDEFGLKKNSIKYFNKLKKEGVECELK